MVIEPIGGEQLLLVMKSNDIATTMTLLLVVDCVVCVCFRAFFNASPLFSFFSIAQ